MFLPSSRYANLAQCQVTQADGSTVTAVKLRMLPQVTGDPTTMTADDRLDIIAGQEYGDGTMFWHIADANTELSAPNLLKQWLPGDSNEAQITIEVPEQ
jgi:hypothetical protein